jgi:CDP-glucose 4,6-dehydratase
LSGPLSDALGGRSIFVTGHTGFKGAWLCQWLHHLGASVTGYALKPRTEPNLFGAAGVAEFLTRSHIADIRDATQLRNALDAAQPEVIFHLAAQALVRTSYREPLETLEVNTLGTARLLEAVRLAGRPCVVVVITSDKCYENHGRAVGYQEADAMGGHDPYSASKGAAELIVSSYRRSFFAPARLSEHGVKLASARAGNVIGGGDWSTDRIVVDIALALANRKPIQVRNPRAIRPWQHVLDPLSGYLELAARLLATDAPEFCSAWNFGPAPESEVSVQELVERFIEAWGEGSWQELRDSGAPHEAISLRLSIEKAARELDWRPCWSLVDAVTRTAEWYQLFFSGASSMAEVCLEQICDYERRAGEAHA